MKSKKQSTVGCTLVAVGAVESYLLLYLLWQSGLPKPLRSVPAAPALAAALAVLLVVTLVVVVGSLRRRGQ